MLLRKSRTLSFILILLSLIFIVGGCAQQQVKQEPATQPPVSNEPAKTNPADKFPEKPITLVIAKGAGGSHDQHARIIERIAQKYLGQPLVIELKPGGGGAIGVTYAANAVPDGYTLLFGSPGENTVVPILEDVTYSRDSFIPIARINYSPCVIFGDPKKYKDVNELIADAKANPGKISYASSGMYQSGHIAFEFFQQGAGITLNHVPMEGAEPQMGVLSGQVPLAGGFASEVVELVNDKKVVPLVVTSQERSKAFPDTPSFKDLGINSEWIMWRTVMAPKGTPPEIVEKLTKAFEQICNDPEFIDLINKLGEEVNYMPGPEFAKFWDEEVVNFNKTFKK